jgi:TPR repeat protein
MDADQINASLWEQSDAWERAQSNEFDLWSQSTDENRARLVSANAISKADPQAAFRIFSDLADTGMAYAMETVAYQYEWGIGVAPDFEQAQAYYRRAIEAGSWMATIKFAALLAHQGHFDVCEAYLGDCVEDDFVPSYFWLAWYRLKQSSSRKTCREIRPLLERAAEAGHPAAERLLARLKLLGKFGLREIPQGFKETTKIIERSRLETSSSESDKDSAGVTITPATVTAL